MAEFKQGDSFAGRYTLTQKLGFGGFSEVWKGEDTMTEGTIVAIKIYAPEKGLDDHGLKQFRREYALTQPLNHTNLLKASYFDITNGSPYLVMPFCSQGSLHGKLMEDGNLSENEVARVLFQVGSGLDYLHAKDILHQDIKPDNILINDDGTYVVTDFGISSRLRSTLRKATTQSNALTVAYAPPERFDKNPNNTEASDVFSLGVMLYELCEGDVPWMGQGGMTLLSGAGVPTINSSYSKKLSNIIEACMQKDATLRPTTKELVESARNFLANDYWNDSFIKKGAPTPPPMQNSGRQTEIITNFTPPVIEQKVDKPIPEPGAKPQKADPNATRMDGVAGDTKPKSKTGLVIALIVVLLLAGGGAGYYFYADGQKQSQFDSALMDGYKLFSQGKYAESKIAFEEALSVFPTNEGAKSGLDSLNNLINDEFNAAYSSGIANMDKSEYSAAIKNFETALVYKPENDSAQYQINLANSNMAVIAGIAQLEGKKYKEAIAKFKEAVAALPSNDVAKNKLEEAEQLLNDEMNRELNDKLIAAVLASNLGDINAAIASGANANTVDANSVPALFWAVKNGNLEIVKILVDKGAKCDNKSGSLWYNSKALSSGVVIAAAYGHLDIVKYFVESCSIGVNDQTYNAATQKNDGWNALAAAAFFGKADIASYLVGKGANVNQVYGGDNMTPLLEACKGGSYDVAKLLLDKKADVKLKTRAGKNAYDLAATSSIRTLLRGYGLGGFEYYDDFSSYSSSRILEQEYSTSQKRAYISGGQLKIQLKADIGTVFLETFEEIDMNSEWEVEIKMKPDNQFEKYGLYFAGSDDDSYRLLIDPNFGSFALKRYRNGNWESVTDYVEKDAIKKGFNSNVIMVKNVGKKIDVYVNGTRVLAGFSISKYPGNQFGVYCEAENAKFSVDYFKISGGGK